MTFDQTVKKPKPSSADPERFDSTRDGNSHDRDTQQQLPVRALLTYPILLSVASYAMLAILDIAYRAMQPLFLSTPIALGGLGLTPARIGALLSAFGLLNGVFQALYFPRIIERFGVRLVYLVGICMFAVLYSMFPLINYVATVGGLNVIVWFLLVVQLAASVSVDMAYGTFGPLNSLRARADAERRVHVYVHRRGGAEQAIPRCYERHRPARRVHPSRDRPCDVDVALRCFSREQLAWRQRGVRLSHRAECDLPLGPPAVAN